MTLESSPLHTTKDDSRSQLLLNYQDKIRVCTRCVAAGFIQEAKPVFRGHVDHRLMVVGQAPGERGHLNSVPYVGATGKTLRNWLGQAGFAENDLYERFYLTSVTKCFPGPSGTGKGDRAPSPPEVHLCRDHLDAEIALVRPELVLAMGRLSATGFIGPAPLDQLVGTLHTIQRVEHRFLVLPLPHPSGVSHWLNRESNKARLNEALKLLAATRIEYNW